MRGTERIAFRRFIESEEYEQQELARMAAEEQERSAAIEREQARLLTMATEILAYFALEAYADVFLSCPDGLAILANCCNFAAKAHDCGLYSYKPELITLATAQHCECWQGAGIVYIETSVGQVSFHALYGEDEGLPEANGRVWSGVEYQFNAGLVAVAWLEGWSKERLYAMIELQVELETEAA